MKPKISIAVFAYKESGSFINVLKAIASQKLAGVDLGQITAVIDGDKDDIYRQIIALSQKIPKLMISHSSKRVGKTGAVNRFFKQVSGDFLVLCDADNQIDDDQLIQKLIQPLLVDDQVGIVGGHPVPIDDQAGFYNWAGRKIWLMHHLIASREPKISGNLYAIRSDLAAEIPQGIILDDVYLEFRCQKHSYQKCYSGQATFGIKVPNNFRDFFHQRFRNHLGYRQLKKRFPDYQVSTLKIGYLTRYFFSGVSTVSELFYLLPWTCLQFYCLLRARLAPLNQKNLNLWPVNKSTKF